MFTVTRFSSDPVDGQHSGKSPKGHSSFGMAPLEAVGGHLDGAAVVVAGRGGVGGSGGGGGFGRLVTRGHFSLCLSLSLLFTLSLSRVSLSFSHVSLSLLLSYPSTFTLSQTRGHVSLFLSHFISALSLKHISL